MTKFIEFSLSNDIVCPWFIIFLILFETNFEFFNNDTNLSNLKLSNILFLPVFNNFL